MCQDNAICQDNARPLTFETMLSDPLIRMVMDSDGVTLPELLEVLEVARAAMVTREATAIRHSQASARPC
jgi:hypothetical protein